MRYLLCLIPPLAVLSCGKPVQFFLNLVLTLLFYIPGLIHAILVVSQFNADRRTDRIVNAMTPASGAPPLPASATQGRSMKFMLLAGAFACVFVFAILAAMVAGLRNRLPAQADKPATTVEEAKPESVPLPATGKNKRKGKGGKNTAETEEAAPDKIASDVANRPALTWTSKDGRVIEAKFIKLDGESVVIEKDGKLFTVPFSNLEAWSVVQAKQLGGVLATDANKKKSSASDEQPKAKLDAYLALVNADPLASKIVESVQVEQNGQRWTATITLRNVWHLRNKQIRLQDAQTLWKAWAVVASKDDPDSARIKLVDLNGNEVGGSRVLAGSLIWVQD